MWSCLMHFNDWFRLRGHLEQAYEMRLQTHSPMLLLRNLECSQQHVKSLAMYLNMLKSNHARASSKSLLFFHILIYFLSFSFSFFLLHNLMLIWHCLLHLFFNYIMKLTNIIIFSIKLFLSSYVNLHNQLLYVASFSLLEITLLFIRYLLFWRVSFTQVGGKVTNMLVTD